MTDPKATGKSGAPAREPKKKTPGTFDRLRPLPANPVEEIIGLTAPENPPQPSPSLPSPTQPTPTQPSPNPAASEAAPNRDFNRRANSLDRDALPKGLFPGTSKKLYDALYLRTRGAVQPVRTVQATRRQLMEWSGIRSKNTIAVNLQILTTSGLVERHLEIGGHEGSIYEVRLPEEVLSSDPNAEPLARAQPSPSLPNPTQPNPTQKLGWVPPQVLGRVGEGNLVENKGTYGFPNTFIKTTTNDDDEAAAAGEAFSAHVALLRQAAKEVTGRDISAAESERWRELAEVLVTELKMAAGRTTVSSVPAFLAEHLRRRLWKTDKSQLEREAAQAARAEAATTPPLDAARCPDCRGTGMFYPEGFERGVARCKHEKLGETPPAG